MTPKTILTASSKSNTSMTPTQRMAKRTNTELLMRMTSLTTNMTTLPWNIEPRTTSPMHQLTDNPMLTISIQRPTVGASLSMQSAALSSLTWSSITADMQTLKTTTASTRRTPTVHGLKNLTKVLNHFKTVQEWTTKAMTESTLMTTTTESMTPSTGIPTSPISSTSGGQVTPLSAMTTSSKTTKIKIIRVSMKTKEIITKQPQPGDNRITPTNRDSTKSQESTNAKTRSTTLENIIARATPWEKEHTNTEQYNYRIEHLDRYSV